MTDKDLSANASRQATGITPEPTAAYDTAEASLALVQHRQLTGYKPLFEVLDFQVTVGRHGNGETYAEATVKTRVGNEVRHTAAEGNGPVSALDHSLRKALASDYPQVRDIHLTGYEVRILDGCDGTSATTRVLIESRNEQRGWNTVGVSANIIQASLEALVDSIEFALLKDLGHALGLPVQSDATAVSPPLVGTAENS